MYLFRETMGCRANKMKGMNAGESGFQESAFTGIHLQ